nr:MDIS1-interacting receptor like kinase 2-like [Ziziphus jujuba var. spinosa]
MPTISNSQKLYSLALFFLFVLLAIVASVSTKEADALLQWKASLQNDPNRVLSSWTYKPNNNSFNSSTRTQPSTTTPCTTWFGISCDIAGSVIGINLTNCGLENTLQNFSFSSFPNLAYFDLSLNSISGTIPPEISSLSKLIQLNLSTNQIFGKILGQIGLVSDLQVLVLSNNKRNGSIPKEIGYLASLTELDVHANSLGGPIPTSLGNLTNLAYLHLEINSLSGLIPLEMGNLSEFVEHYLNNNTLKGPIPSSFGNFKKLKVLSFFKTNSLVLFLKKWEI